MKKSFKSKRGLCLIEMILVIAIICILASVLCWNFMSILRLLDFQLF